MTTTPGRPGLVLTVVLAVQFMVVLDATIVSVAAKEEPDAAATRGVARANGGQDLVQAGAGAAGAGEAALVDVDPSSGTPSAARAWRWAVRSCRTAEHLA